MDARAPKNLANRVALVVFGAAVGACALYAHAGDSVLGIIGVASSIGLAAALAHRMAARADHHAGSEALRKMSEPITELSERNQQLASQNQRLRRSNQVLEQLSITDGLTQLNNHRSFQDQLTREIKRVHRVHESLSLLMVDIDDFKALNDRFGHAAGDELLRRLALIMSEAIRESDLLARYGGEEFVVLAPNTEMFGAYQLAEKLRTAIAESSFVLDESRRPTRVTVSIGVAEYAGNRVRFFHEADRALYCAKAAGKNCVVTGDPDEIG